MPEADPGYIKIRPQQPKKVVLRMSPDDDAGGHPLRFRPVRAVPVTGPTVAPAAPPRSARPGAAPHEPPLEVPRGTIAHHLASDPRRSLGTRYRLQRKLGEGGTGAVFHARDLLLEMPVAIKVLNPGLAKDRAAVRTLRHEARITLQLSHRHIVRLHNLEKVGNTYFLVMEYVEGDTLRTLFRQYGALPPETAVSVVCVFAEALAYAHRHSVLHNDLKPENVMLSKDGILKVIDFGIACLINRQWHDEYIRGTPIYMSPEQILGEPLDVTTDVYALGMITYEMLAGHPALDPGPSSSDVRLRESLALSALSDGVRAVVAKATAYRREDRWASVTDFATAFCAAMGMRPSADAPVEE